MAITHQRLRTRRNRHIASLLLTCSLASPLIADDALDRPQAADDIVTAVIGAPVVTNGLVADEPTEFNILLAARDDDRAGLDPRNRGLRIPAGGWVEVELSGSFKRNVDDIGLPVVSPLAANTHLILTTGPQNPIVATAGDGVQHGNWSLQDDGQRLITLTPNGARGLENARAMRIGVKVIHLRPAASGQGPAPFINGPAGSVGTVSVRIYNPDGSVRHAGYEDIVFQPNIGRQVHVTNAGLTTASQGSADTLTAELIENTDFQRVRPNTALLNTEKAEPFSAGKPYAPRFLLFEALAAQPDSFLPQLGIADVSYEIDPQRPWTATLVQGNSTGDPLASPTTIGAVYISGPSEMSRGELLPNSLPTVLNGNGSILNIPVRVGHMRGDYHVTVELIGGGSATNTIIVGSDRGDGDDDEDEDDDNDA